MNIFNSFINPCPSIVKLPYTGGNYIYDQNHCYNVISDPLNPPAKSGWYLCQIDNRQAKLLQSTNPEPDALQTDITSGYLFNGKLIPEHIAIPSNIIDILPLLETVYLIDSLKPFTKITVGRIQAQQPFIFKSIVPLLSTENEVYQAYYSHQPIDHIKHIPPALDLAFKLHQYYN